MIEWQHFAAVIAVMGCVLFAACRAAMNAEAADADRADVRADWVTAGLTDDEIEALL